MSGEAGAILAAAGTGTRFGGKKQFLRLRGRPLIHYSLDALWGLPGMARLVLVVPPDDVEEGRVVLRDWVQSRRADASRFDVVAGGDRRQASVLNALRRLRSEVEYVVVHDAARPLLRPQEAARVLEAARRHGAAVIGTPVTDSVKRAREGFIVESLRRDEVWTVQTPQVARLEDILQAYESAGEREFTDESSALLALGRPVALVEGSPDNIKITRWGDLERAEGILDARRADGTASGGTAGGGTVRREASPL